MRERALQRKPVLLHVISRPLSDTLALTAIRLY